MRGEVGVLALILHIIHRSWLAGRVGVVPLMFSTSQESITTRFNIAKLLIQGANTCTRDKMDDQTACLRVSFHPS